MKKILVIDVGGSNVKMMISQEEKRRKFPSGPKLGPEEAVKQIREATQRLEFRGDFDRVSRPGAGGENRDRPKTSRKRLGRV